MRHGSAFAGIEGMGLGLLLAGLPVETVWQSEIDPFCLELLAARFPEAEQVGDVRELDGGTPRVDVLSAGFPCQPVSQAGRGKAQADERWLWDEVERLIRLLEPPLVLLENVRGLRSRGLSIILSDLAALGYDAQWDLIPAAAVGAPHLRHRFWIVAYPSSVALGRVFDRRPPVFPWAPEAEALPRLLPKVPRRRERLTALGNAVVPQAAAHVALAVEAARRAPAAAPETLFGMPPESYGDAPPYAGLLLGGLVHEVESCAPRVEGRLWPTAAADDASWSLEALMACVHEDGSPARDPHKRFYHPETGQIVQRGLVNYVKGVEAGLWLSPTADPWSKGGCGGELQAQVKDAEELYPTPTASDAIGSRRATAQREGWTSNTGTTLTDRVWEDEGVDPREVDGQFSQKGELLWPTPAARDSKGPSGAGFLERRNGGPDLAAAAVEAAGLYPTPQAADGAGGRVFGAPENGSRPSGAKAQTTLADAAREAEQLWPTPQARDFKGPQGESYNGNADDLPGAVSRAEGSDSYALAERDLWPTPMGPGGQRRSRHALVEAEQWSAPGLEQAAELADGILPREFEDESELNSTARQFWPTPLASDADGSRGSKGADRPDEGGLRKAAESEERLWPTPKASPSGPDFARAGRDESGGDDLATSVVRDEVEAKRPVGGLNPEWCGWLMGFPLGWTDV